MRNVKQKLSAALGFTMIFILIIDSKTSVQAVRDGIMLSLQTVLPALFPMSVLTAVLTTSSFESLGIFFKSIGRLCKLDSGTESIFLTGILGGYPLGARNISIAHKEHKITTKRAEQLLPICNNAGPAFIFGMCFPLFSSPTVCWLLWLVQIVSAVITANIIPTRENQLCTISNKSISLSQIMNTSIQSMAIVCGWVILFKVLITFMEKWVIFMFMPELKAIISIFLELTNGVVALQEIGNEGIRFIICSFGLSFGGLCIIMQTKSLIGSLKIKYYLIGILLKSAISASLSFVIYLLYFNRGTTIAYILIFLLFTALSPLILQIIVEFFQTIMYNTRKTQRGYGYAVSKKNRAPL